MTEPVALRLGRALADVDPDALRNVLCAIGDDDRAQLLAVLAEVHRREVREAIGFGAMTFRAITPAAEDPLLLDALTDRYLDQETT